MKAKASTWNERIFRGHICRHWTGIGLCRVETRLKRLVFRFLVCRDSSSILPMVISYTRQAMRGRLGEVCKVLALHLAKLWNFKAGQHCQ